MLVPAPTPQHDPHDGEHDRHFDQHADDGRQRRPGLKTEQRDRRGDRELEKIRSPNQRRRAGDVMRNPERAVDRVGNASIEIDLNHDRHRQQRDNERLPDDLLALKSEQQHQSGQQGDQRDRL